METWTSMVVCNRLIGYKRSAPFDVEGMLLKESNLLSFLNFATWYTTKPVLSICHARNFTFKTIRINEQNSQTVFTKFTPRIPDKFKFDDLTKY